MKGYSYDLEGKLSGEYVFTKNDYSPISGKLQVPARVVFDAPPEKKEGFDIYWHDGGWEYRKAKPDPSKLPEPTFAELVERKINELKGKRLEIESSPIEHNGNLFDYDVLARERLSIARQALEDAGGGSIAWTTADNGTEDLTVSDFAAITAKAAARSNDAHIKYREIRQLVDEAKTKENLEKITWPED